MCSKWRNNWRNIKKTKRHDASSYALQMHPSRDCGERLQVEGSHDVGKPLCQVRLHSARTGDPDPSHLMSMLLRFFLITVTSSTTLYRIEGSRIEPNGSYPTPGDGHEFKMNIFGLLFSTQGRWQKRRERRKVDTLCLWKIRSLAATQTL